MAADRRMCVPILLGRIPLASAFVLSDLDHTADVQLHSCECGGTKPLSPSRATLTATCARFNPIETPSPSVRGGKPYCFFFDLGDADVSVVRAEGASFEDVDGLNRSRLDAALSSPAFFCIVIR